MVFCEGRKTERGGKSRLELGSHCCLQNTSDKTQRLVWLCLAQTI